MHIVDVAVAVIVNSGLTIQFGKIDPHIGFEVFVAHIDTFVMHGYNDVCSTCWCVAKPQTN